MKNTLSLSVCLVCLFLVTLSKGGSLNPAAPPTAGTMKPLDQVEPRIPITSMPFTISQSGSYYLTKNLTATGTAITINVDDVTLDLCGFTLTGPASGTNFGIYMNNRKNIEIRNGTIRNFGYDGIVDAGASSSNHRIISVQLFSNGRHGIYLISSYDLVKDCMVNGNGNSVGGVVYGIYAFSYGTITGNTVSNNGTAASITTSAYGIYANAGSKVIGNTVYGNGTYSSVAAYGIYCVSGSTVTGNSVFSNGFNAPGGVYGVYASFSGNMVSGNTVSSNGTYAAGAVVGIYIQDSGTVMDNTLRSNAGNGITALTFCRIINNTITYNLGTGISVGDNSTISGNTVGSNTLAGINAGDHVTVTGNTISSNGGSGIACTGGYIAKNTVSLNNMSAVVGQGGIVVSNHSQIKENTLEGNTKNNIYVTGARSSIENNVMSGSDYGINFSSTGNVYLNNRATCNGTNYNPAGNTDGGGNISF